MEVYRTELAKMSRKERNRTLAQLAGVDETSQSERSVLWRLLHAVLGVVSIARFAR